MNRIDSAWRFSLGQKLGAAYALNPKVRAIQVAGSTGRGTADRYSDLEIDVYWDEPPTPEERIEAVERTGGILLSLAEDDDEWEEQMDFGGFHAATSMFLVSTMERYLHEVLEEFSTGPNPNYKSMDELIANLRIKPHDLAVRLKAAYHLPPTEGVQMLHAVIEEIFQLVERVLPTFDVSLYREKVRRRGQWDSI